jgi:pimeloyl-ACP methyl ester carboxylesterase
LGRTRKCEDDGCLTNAQKIAGEQALRPGASGTADCTRGISHARATASLACVPTWHEDFRKDLARIDVPTLVIHGDADRILPITAAGLRSTKLIKGARLLVVKDGPHCVQWTHADEVNAELLGFLGEKAGKLHSEAA